MIRLFHFSLLALALQLPLIAATYEGPETCRACHTQEHGTQATSHHAKALGPIRTSPVAEYLQKESGAQIHGEILEFQLAPGSEGTPPSIVWAFGAGVQGITPVGLLNGRYFENRHSLYTRPRKLDVTFGHAARQQGSLGGIKQTNTMITRCFNCHATGVRAGSSQPDLSAMFPGVTCERCHGPGSDHVAAAKQKTGAAAVRQSIFNPSRLKPRGQIEFCGQCHRLPGPENDVPEPELADREVVRFAPIGILASQCFRKSNRLTCTTCHDPHTDLVAETGSTYAAKCQSCHAPDATVTSHCPRASNKACVSCHMQKASLSAYLHFTDHRIRVYRP